MADIPDELLRRSAAARAAAEGVSVEDILARWSGEAPAPQAPPAETAAPAATEVTPAPAPAAAALTVAEYAKAAAEASGMPEKLLMRSAQAKAKAQGVPIESVLADMAGLPDPGSAPAPAATSPTPQAAPAAAAALSTEQYAKAAAEASGMPEKLLMRSAQAKAKAQGVPVESVLADMAGLPDPGSAPALAPTGTNGTTAVATAPAPAPAAVPAGPPEGVRTQRLLTVVQADAIQQVKAEPTDKVNVWPHLLAVEFVALLVVTAVLIVISVIINAPLLEAANFNLTPNPSKAPWYFLGLQELLSYFDPMIAGVLIPGLIGLVGLMAIPYIDRNPSVRPADRKLAIMMFTFFLMGAATLVILGSFFRGPGFNFTYPWSDGVFFDDLKDWLE
ncbi:MAG: hypothetical protein OER12_02885 [Acidimicrobiia bacterium]|nr:hypothetical protein [Acidimicrobiia bacterium]